METIAFFFWIIFIAMLDVIIVGYGLAGFNCAWQMKQRQKKYIVISDPSQGASSNAAGICNPTVLKRYTLAWNGIQFLDYALPYYQSVETQLGTTFFDDLPIHRHFFKATEQNEWLVASQREGLSTFLNPEVQKVTDRSIKNNAGFGILEHLGKLNINDLLNKFKDSQGNDRFREQIFDYAALKIYRDKIVYKGIEAKKIIFCEGYGLKRNPWFDYLPLTGSKGEYLIIRTSKLSSKQIIKGPIFISPLKEDLFWVGASFSRQDKTNIPSEQGKAWLIKKLDMLLNPPYKIVKHAAAVRPTVADRRPLLGVHPDHSNLYLLNGLGTRGVLMAPLLSQWLIDFIENKKQIPSEVVIDRFESYFSNRITKHV